MIRTRKLQIGVMGSMADLQYSEKIERLAFDIGKYIAQSGNIVVYGAEKDSDSLSTSSARGAKSVGGLIVGVTYGKGKEIWAKDGLTDVIVVTGMERGGGREFVLVNSCDAIIIISGGSGTLTEIAIAYQMNIPVVVLTGTGGWADKLAGQYLDERKRLKIEAVSTPEEAINRVLELVNQRW